MKRMIVVFLLATLFSFPAILTAEEAHEQEYKASPKGGKVLEGTEPLAEFYLEKDRTATVTLYDHEMKPIPIAEQSMTVIADSAGEKTKIDFEKKGNVLVSREALPNGPNLNLVVQYKQDAEAKPKNYRFMLNETICPECNRAEYGCICQH